MRALAIAALSACGATASPPSPPSHHAAPPSPAAPSWDPIELAVDRSAPLAITARATNIMGEPTHELTAAFGIHYDAVALRPLADGAELTNRVRCRVVGVNLYLPDFGLGYRFEGEHTHFVRDIVSLVEVPAACEIGFAYRRSARTIEHPSDNAHDQPIVATACLDAHGLRAGACPPGTFPPPVLPAGATMGLTMAKHSFTDAMGGGIVFDGGVIFADAPVAGQHYTLAYTCDSGATGELDLHDLTELEMLDVLPAGSTLALTSMVSGDPAPTARSGRCEVTLSSREPPVTRGTYCLANGDGVPGPCRKP
jgi:hypothetical protein